MISDPDIREQGYIYFLREAPELLQVIEQELLTLPEERSTAKIHSLMRATHTLKGGAANVGLEVIKTVAHYLEDVVKCLYNPEVVIDTELQTLLLQGYECLREPLMAELHGGSINEEEILNRASGLFVQLQTKLGDFFGAQAQIPTSDELGFDIVESVFEIGVQQRLEGIAAAIDSQNAEELTSCLRSDAEVFVGLAESLNLPGFGAIATTTLAAIDAYPERILEIAIIALADFQKAREQVLAGDRTDGGTPSKALQQLAGQQESSRADGHERELEQFGEFLTSDRYQEPLQPQLSKVYLKIARYCLGWFHRYQNIPLENLSLALLVPKLDTVNQSTSLQEANEAAKYVEDWLDRFSELVKDEADSQSICLYRQAAILTVVLAVAKFLYFDQTNQPDNSNIPIIKIIQHRRRQIVKQYKNQPPITESDKKWLERPQLQQLMLEPENNSLVEEIWGNPIAAEASEIQMVEEIWGNPVVAEASEIQLNPAQAIVIPDTKKKEENGEKAIPSQSQETKNLKSKIQNQSVRVDLEELERLNYLAGNLLINQNRQLLQDEELQEAVQNLHSNLRRHQQTLNQLREWSNLMLTEPDYLLTGFKGNKLLGFLSKGGSDNRQQTTFDSLELDQYTELYHLFNSALEQTVQLAEATDVIDRIAKQLNYTLDKQQSLLSRVRTDLTALQMLPLGDVLGRFPRMIQQLVMAKKKPVELTISGGEVLIDKAIAEKLYDPLLHLVRNAFDHGIESLDIRQQRVKPPTGKIEIRAYHQGNQTIIEVRDDGQGLDFDAIRRRAVEQNFVSAEQVNNLSKAQLLDLLFEPGFSTAQTLSDISGRGIGLDVVREQVKNLQGSIRVESQPQMGTTFSLQIPFSLTSAKFFVCQVSGVSYALSSETITKIVLPLPGQIQVIEGKKLLMYSREYDTANSTDKDITAVPVYQLSALLHYNELSVMRHPSSAGAKTNQLLLLRGNTGFLGLEVDQILGEQELVIRPLGSAIAAPSYIVGCSILGNGRLILAIDGAVLLEQAISSITVHSPMLSAFRPESSAKIFTAAHTSVGQLPPAIALTPVTVLVVDDSLSYRQTLAMNLQKAGYQVLQAQDGLEALQQLRQSSDIKLVICDIEMPRMNGFEFLKQRRQEPALANIPVVMLTSRTSDKHRLLALNLGATAYFTKPYLENELLTALADLQQK